MTDEQVEGNDKSLFDVMMPNGKRFGDCTFADMNVFGERMNQIAEKIGPGRTVGDLPVGTLTYNDLALMRGMFELEYVLRKRYH